MRFPAWIRAAVFVILLALLPCLGLCAPVRVQSAKANTGASSAMTLNIVFGSSLTAGNVVVLAVATNGAVPNIAPSSSISTMQCTAIGASGSLVTIIVGKIFSGATTTLAVDVNSSTSYAVVGAEYSGVAAVFDRRSVGSGNSASPASAATSTTSSADQLWIGAIGVRNEVTFSSATGSFTVVDQDKSSVGSTNGRTAVLLEQIPGTTGTPAVGGSISLSSQWAAEVLTIQPLPSGTTGYSRGRGQ